MATARWKRFLGRIGAFGLAVSFAVGSNVVSAQTTTVPQRTTVPQPTQLRVSTKPIEPFVIIDKNGAVRGLSIDLWNEIDRRLGTKTTWQVRANVKEILADVETGKADAAIAGISMTPEREAQVDFTHPYFDSGLQILTRQSSSKSAPRLFFDTVTSRRVFEPFLWVMAAAVVMAHLMWFSQRRKNPDFPKGYGKGMWESTWWAVVNVMTGGDASKTVNRGVGRVLAFLWMTLGVLMIAYLTGQFSSAVTVADLKSDINGPGDLFGRKVETTSGSTAAAYLDQIGLPHRDVDAITAASYQRLLSGQIDAIVYDSPTLRYAASKFGGRLNVAGPIFHADKYAIALPPNSVLREHINEVLLQLQADGTMTNLSTKWFGAE
jgi:polar amino acid transport system substrate-binding protein